MSWIWGLFPILKVHGAMVSAPEALPRKIFLSRKFQRNLQRFLQSLSRHPLRGHLTRWCLRLHGDGGSPRPRQNRTLNFDEANYCAATRRL